MGEMQLDDPKKLTQPIPSSWGYGLLNNQFIITRIEELDYAMTLIEQAYNYVTG